MSGLKEAGRPFGAAHDPRAKLFTHGGSQAVRLPKAFRFEGSEVSIRKEGDAVILEPVKAKRPPTMEEMDAFWRELDDKYGDLVIEDIERDKSPARELPEW